MVQHLSQSRGIYTALVGHVYGAYTECFFLSYCTAAVFGLTRANGSKNDSVSESSLIAHEGYIPVSIYVKYLWWSYKVRSN